MRGIKFRQVLKSEYAKSYGGAFHHWGYGGKLKGFVSPVSVNHSSHESEQFTGLQDKNGTDIYEGDVLKFKWLYQDGSVYIEDKWINGVVEYMGGKFIVRYYGSWFDVGDINQLTFERFWRETYNSAKADYFKMIGFEVIGNIHENTELLESDND